MDPTAEGRRSSTSKKNGSPFGLPFPFDSKNRPYSPLFSSKRVLMRPHVLVSVATTPQGV
jgi:hypothetical protein